MKTSFGFQWLCRAFSMGLNWLGTWTPAEIDLVSKMTYLTKCKPMENIQIIAMFIVTPHPQKCLVLVNEG